MSFLEEISSDPGRAAKVTEACFVTSLQIKPKGATINMKIIADPLAGLCL